MNEYLLSIIGTVLLSAVLTAIIPEGKTSAVIKNITKFCCILIIISPILQFFHKGSASDISVFKSENFFGETVIQTDEDFIKYYSEMRIQQTEEVLSEKLFERYSVSCEVWLDWSFEGDIRIERIVVKLLENVDEEVKGEMRLFLVENCCGEVLIE